MFLCSCDLGSSSCLFLFKSDVFLCFNFFLCFFNFVKINIYFLKLDADIDVDMVFIIIIIILPRQHLACPQCTSFVTSNFSITELTTGTKIKTIF